MSAENYNTSIKEEEEDFVSSLMNASAGPPRSPGSASARAPKREFSADSSDDDQKSRITKSFRTTGADSGESPSMFDSQSEASVSNTQVKKEEGEEATLTKKVIYSSLGPWYGNDWHLVGDGVEFVMGFSWSSPTIQGSWPVTYPNDLTGEIDIMSLLPASKHAFWNDSAVKLHSRKGMNRKIIDRIHFIRETCGYNVPAGLQGRDQTLMRVTYVELPSHADVSFRSFDLIRPPGRWFSVWI